MREAVGLLLAPDACIERRVQTMFLLSAARSAACSFLFLCLFLVHSLPVTAATGGQVRGRVTGPDGKPLPGVAVVLANDITGYRQQVTTGPDGGYLLYNVPANPYHLTANVQGFTPFHADVDVRGALVHDITLDLAEVTASTTVAAEKEPVALESDDPSTHIDIDKSLIRRSAAAMPGRAFESIVTSTPGFSQDENGRYHFQGGIRSSSSSSTASPSETRSGSRSRTLSIPASPRT
jgi:hypothetical protein